MTATQTLQAYDDAFRIVQDAVMRQHSLIGMNLLTRVEFYLLNQSRQHVHLDPCEKEELGLADNAAPLPRRLPWCETGEDYESVVAELAAEQCRWS